MNALANIYQVSLLMENGKTIDWEGEADDEAHAEGLAAAYAIEKTGEQIAEQLDCTEFEQISEYEAEERYNDMLDDCYPDCEIAGMSYCTSRALKELDPIAYNCGFSDFCSSLYEDGIKVEGF
jgi:hypothetical protein